MKNPNRVCGCGQGYRSAYDGKCGHCRTKREREAHLRMIYGRPSYADAKLAAYHGFTSEDPE